MGKPRCSRGRSCSRLQQYPNGCAGLRRSGWQGTDTFNPASPHLDQIEKACRRAADLCRQLLAYAGRGHIAAGKTDLNQLIRNSASLLGVPASKSAAIRYEMAPGLPLSRPMLRRSDRSS